MQHSNMIYDVQLQKTLVLRMRPRHQATLMQPLQSDLQIPNCKTQKNYAQRREKLQLQNRMDLGTKPKKTIHAAITMRFASRTLREN